jgi:molecular chaperone DnaJ
MAISLAISLEEAAQGLTRTITLDRLAPCDECDATGSADKKAPVTCPTCKGTGQAVGYRQTFLGSMQVAQVCADCGGSGQIVQNPCPECEGSGRVIDRQQLDVAIPAGISDGQKIRMKEMGEAGIRGAKSGDLLITVRVQQHERFEREGNNLHVRLPISIAEAAIGTTKRIDGLLDEVIVEVPAGAQTGERVTIKRSGMPVINREDTFGDLICHLDVVVPRKLSTKAQTLLAELSAELGDSETSNADDLKNKDFGSKVKDFFKGRQCALLFPLQPLQ